MLCTVTTQDARALALATKTDRMKAERLAAELKLEQQRALLLFTLFAAKTQFMYKRSTSIWQVHASYSTT
jgi:hypothetical protein